MPAPALSQDQILAACARHNCNVTPTQYSELPESTTEVAQYILSHPKILLWLKTQPGPDAVGHWNAIRREGMDIGWFSSYGMLPDGEKVATPFASTVDGQNINKVARALHALHNLGFRIHYSAVPLQQIGDGSVSCGVWCTLFLTTRERDFERLESKLASLRNPEAYAFGVYKKEFSS